MRQVALVVLCLIGFAACQETKPSADPWVNLCEDMIWMDSVQGVIRQNGWSAEIFITHYKEERVFEVHPCLECADVPTTVHNCSGEVVCEFGGLAGVNTCPDYAPSSDKKLLYWKN